VPKCPSHRNRRVPGALATTVFVLLATAGCKSAISRGPQLAPAPTPPGLWTEERIENGWITVNVGLPHHGRPPYPVVLNPIVPDHQLLALGIGVVRWKTNWDLLEPFGERAAPEPKPQLVGPPREKVGVWLLRSDRPGIIGKAYFSLITYNAHKTVPAVIDYLLGVRGVDPERIAITGSSTGGFTALQAMAEDPRLALGVIQVACGDYLRFLRSSSLALDDQDRWLVDGRMVLDEDYEAQLLAIAPIRRSANFPPRPLLLLSGAEDRAIPAACVRATAERFAEVYADAQVSDRFEWIEFEDGGHNLGPEAPPLVLEFLDRWLVQGRRSD